MPRRNVTERNAAPTRVHGMPHTVLENDFFELHRQLLNMT